MVTTTPCLPRCAGNAWHWSVLNLADARRQVTVARERGYGHRMRRTIGVLLVMGVCACSESTSDTCSSLGAHPDASCSSVGVICHDEGIPNGTCYCGDAGWLCGFNP